jgi:hypothetical protein
MPLVYESYNLPWEQAKLHYEWARKLSKYNRSGPENGESKNLLSQAQSIWRSIGASPWAERSKTEVS